MKQILLAGVALGALAIPAFAADMAPLPKAPPLLSWTGFYVGGNVGWAGSTDAITNSEPIPAPAVSARTSSTAAYPASST